MATTKELARLLLNVVGLLSNAYGFSFVVGAFPSDIGFGGIFQFLTIIGLTSVKLKTKKINHFVAIYKHIAYVATPMEGLITILYWPMVLYSKELLQHQEVPFFLPLPLDMSLHLWPAVLLWIDFLAFDVEFVRSKTHIVVIYAFTVWYLGWSSYCFARNGFWVYPFLSEFSTIGRATFFMFCGNVCVAMYEAGKVFIRMVVSGNKLAGDC
ncbi:FAR-17a/AIG1-like protein [Zychaea mexicana]|uniref:FAR-17a/AIG1-like protein n=1 Tax=Zychaea mexicana TaxID=64656 RepID=UPI0022FE9737|nr:FAR-17a/AIG1-like protein [Zychaea mexicana]KAI9494817.1 FAR-17a/AIG1-like protein [Zychaea mexicana]